MNHSDTMERMGIPGNVVLGLAFITFCLSTTRWILDGPESVIARILAAAGVGFMTASLLFWLDRRELAGHLVCFVGLLTTGSMPLVEGGLQSEALFWTPFVGFLAVFFLGYRWAMVYGTFAIVGILITAYFTGFDPIYVLASTSAAGFALLVGVFYERNRMLNEQKLNALASFHPLTKLPSRNVLDLSLRQTVARAKRRNENYGIVFIDVDGLKTTNDTLGHAAGDALLKEVSRRLDDVTRIEERPFHVSGDEFVVVAEQVPNQSMAKLRERIKSIESKPFEFEGRSVPVRISVGTSVGGAESEVSDVLAAADSDMYIDKNAKREFQPEPTPTLEREPPKLFSA